MNAHQTNAYACMRECAVAEVEFVGRAAAVWERWRNLSSLKSVITTYVDGE